MFLSSSVRSRSTVARLLCTMPLLLVALCLLCTISCTNANSVTTKPISNAYGTWESTYNDSYRITETTFSNYYSDALSFEWHIEGSCATENGGNTYYIYGKVTQAIDTGYGAPYTVGQYTAAYIEILPDNAGLKISCAYLSGTNQNESLAVVKETFTDENGYYSYKAEYAADND